MRLLPVTVLSALALLASAVLAQGASDTQETAIFAGGCFWSMEAVFDDVPGVISATAGYTGGTVPNPTYEQVSAGDTGHVEAVKVVYDPQKISYGKLLNLFWHNVDPFNANGQFCDGGPEYRSEIFTTTAAQDAASRESKAVNETLLNKQMVTKIVAATAFYPAEEYHQKFKKKNPLRYALYRQGCGRDARLEQIWGNH